MESLKLFLSYNSILTFYSCKRKFKYKYIDRVDIGNKVSRRYDIFSNTIHRVLAQYNFFTDQSKKNVEMLQDLYRINWVSGIYTSLGEDVNQYEKGKDMLAKYYKAGLDQGKKNYIIEGPISVDMENLFYLCGRFDKVYKRNDNLIEVLDYRTEDRIDMISDIQIYIYAIMLYDKLGICPDIISSYYLALDKKIDCCIKHINIDFMYDSVFEIYKKIDEEEDFCCSPNRSCSLDCEYFGICTGVKDESSCILTLLNNEQLYEEISSSL